MTRVLSVETVRRIDQLALDQYGMSGLVLMENAGRGVADVITSLANMPEAPELPAVVICCGKGNNAGDGLVIARHLDFRGHPVQVMLAGSPDELADDARVNYEILKRAEFSICQFADLNDSGLTDLLASASFVVDGLLGTGAKGDPRSPYDAIIDCVNACNATRIALDLPSGLNAETGVAGKPTIHADHTCTFVAAKPGLVAQRARQFVGKLHLIEIGIPRRLLNAM